MLGIYVLASPIWLDHGVHNHIVEQTIGSTSIRHPSEGLCSQGLYVWDQSYQYGEICIIDVISWELGFTEAVNEE